MVINNTWMGPILKFGNIKIYLPNIHIVLHIVRIKKRKIICILDPLSFLGEEVNLMPCQEG